MKQEAKEADLKCIMDQFQEIESTSSGTGYIIGDQVELIKALYKICVAVDRELASMVMILGLEA